MPPKKRASYGSGPTPKRRQPTRSNVRQQQSTDRQGRKGSSANKSKDQKSEDETESPWVPPKTKRSRQERSIGFPGAVVPRKLKDDKDFSKHELVLQKGPDGPPVYDSLGYKLCFKAIYKGSFRRGPPSTKKLLAMMDAETRVTKRKAEIMGQPENENILLENAWHDKVARDLDIPFHTVGLPEFEEWHRRGFRLEPGELRDRPPKEELDRLFTLMANSALREESRTDE